MISDSKTGKLYEVIAPFYNGTLFQTGDLLVFLEEKESVTSSATELVFLSPQHGKVLFYAYRSLVSVWFSYLREIPGDDE